MQPEPIIAAPPAPPAPAPAPVPVPVTVPGADPLRAAPARPDVARRSPGTAWLVLGVHLHAIRVAPRAWLAAAWWRLAGRRLRARWLRTPLIGSAPGAYRLWLARNAAARPPSPPPRADEAAIVALVAPGDEAAGAGGGSAGYDAALAVTRASLAAEGIALLVAGPAAASARIDWSARPWLLPLAPGDILAPGAAAAYRAAVAGARARIAYADDDIVDRAGRRATPHFKPDWNAELQRHHDYLSGAMIARPTRAELALAAQAPDWPRALVEALAVQAPPIHLRAVLHHRRARPAPRVPAPRVPAAPSPDPATALPPASVIIPTRNRADLLAACLAGLAATRYPALEIIVVDNDSDDPATLALLAGIDPARGPVPTRVLRHPGAFNFAAINNRAARIAQGRLLCLLNNDVAVIEPGWLATLATQALRDEVGAVGARLLYPDGRIQHAGVVLGLGTGAGHAHRRLHPDEPGYFRRHALPQFVSAVTAACLVVDRRKFDAVGGFDAQAFPIAFNDVDLCMALNARGWQALYEPRATLVHHESLSRGFDRDRAGAARLAGELAALRRRWVPEGAVDPFHHPALSRFSERFVVDL